MSDNTEQGSVNDVVFDSEPTHDNNKQEKAQEESSQESGIDGSGTDVGSPSSLRPSNAVQTAEFSNQPSANPDYSVSLPSVSLYSINAKLRSFNTLNLDDKDAGLKTWRDVVQSGIDYYTVGGLYQDRFEETGSSFQQGVLSSSGDLNSIAPLKFKSNAGEIKGEIALLKVSKMLGLGDVVNIPLPHSGIWVTIKPPTEKDLIDFYNSIFREKIMLGRTTFGLTLTNFSVHINNRLFDFMLKHIHSINYGDLPKEDLKNYVLIHDFPILAWGFASTMYPNGFDYQRACVNDVQTCSHIAKAKLNLAKLLWVDNPSLTDAQKKILEEFRPNKLGIDSYRKFISEHVRVSGSTFTTKNGMKFRLKVPTFNEYTTDGLAWVSGINAAIENIILLDADNQDDDTKTEMLNQYVKTSILRQFNHFIDFIDLGDGETIQDRATINTVLEAFSAQDDIRAEITENILKFKTKTTIGVIGIPEYKCPNCGHPQNPNATNENFVNVIPLDTMNLFFTLITLRISKILEREV